MATKKKATPGDPGRAPGLTGVLCRFDEATLAELDRQVEAARVPKGGTRGRGGGRIEYIRRLIWAASGKST